MSVIQDISDVKLTQMKLEESELRFRTLLDSMPTISVQGYDEEGKTLYWNKGSEKVYGYSKEEFLSMSLKDIRPKDDVTQLLQVQHDTKTRDGVITFGIFNSHAYSEDLIG